MDTLGQMDHVIVGWELYRTMPEYANRFSPIRQSGSKFLHPRDIGRLVTEKQIVVTVSQQSVFNVLPAAGLASERRQCSDGSGGVGEV